MWKQRTLPPSAAQVAATVEAARAQKVKASRLRIEEEVIPKKRAAGRGPPKQRGSASKKGKKRDRFASEEEEEEEEEEEDEDEDFAAAASTGTSSRPASRRAAAAPKNKKAAKGQDAEKPKKKMRGSRLREEVWEEVPQEWLAKNGKQGVDEKGERERSVGASSNLTSIADEMDVDSEEEEDEEEEEEEEEEGEAAEEDEGQGDENEARPAWEREYWAQREIIDAPGFNEWQTVRSSSLGA